MLVTEARIGRHLFFIRIRIEHRERKIVVVMAVPTPVEMEEACTVVTVAYESMTTSSSITAIDDRPACCQFTINKFLPVVDANPVTTNPDCTLIITEVVAQRFGYG